MDHNPAPQADVHEELRLAVVLNGGVSLAVWIGGVTLEIDRMTRRSPVYRELLDLLKVDARADVITGTSAGGINGAALALGQVNDTADLRRLRDLWAAQGRMETLLRTPFRGEPSSLLKGDEYFWPSLENALERLATDFAPRPADQRPVHLGITATLLDGVRRLQSDSLGQALPQELHAGLMTFRHLADDHLPDDFSASALPATVRRLALAARSSASFPVAFEPSFLPVGMEAPLGARPDLTPVAEWHDRFGPADQSRYAIDGGAMMNTPTEPALRAIQDMPPTAGAAVRRVMLMVFPHAPVDFERPAADPQDPPTLLASLLGAAHATRNEASRTHVDTIERHNRRAGERRSGRAEVLISLQSRADSVPQEIDELAATLFEFYRELRLRRAGRDLAERAPTVQGWSYDRARGAVDLAQDALRSRGAWPPYLQAEQDWEFDPNGGWPWGVTTAEHVGEDASDLARRLVRLTGYQHVGELRQLLFTIRRDLAAQRRAFEEIWCEPGFASLAPSQAYWSLWMRAYGRAFLGGEELTAADFAGVVDDDVRELVRRLNAALPSGLLGRRVAHLLAHLAVALLDLRSVIGLAIRRAEGDERRLLLAWRKLLRSTDDPAALVTLLVRLDVVITSLSSAPERGSENVIELVQVSLQTRNAFAQVTTRAGDKLGGARLNRFAGFLKESWRINDWIWGRLDGATMLCRVLLEPQRVRRALAPTVVPGRDPAAEAERQVAEWVQTLFPDGSPGAGFDQVQRRAREELARYVYAVDPAPPATLEAVADLFAWAIQADALAEDLPALGNAVLADRREGAIRSSSGERLIEEQAQLIDDLRHLPIQPLVRALGDPVADAHPGPRRRLGAAALVAFDEAGVGREPLDKEASGDLLIRTGTTAVAVGATVLDSPKLGIPQAKPLTRAIRGAALLPYWAARGLTSGGRILQAAALAVLALGGAMLAFSLVVPDSPRWVPLIGLSAAIFVFALAALRTGSVLHGLVLLAVVAPLGTYAVADQFLTDGSSDLTIAVIPFVLALIAGLMILGSLPGQVRSPFATAVDRLADPTRSGAGVVVGVVAVYVVLLGIAWGLVEAGTRAWIAGLVGTAFFGVLGFFAYRWTRGFRLRYYGPLPSRWPKSAGRGRLGMLAALLVPAVQVALAAFLPRVGAWVLLVAVTLAAVASVVVLLRRPGPPAETADGWRTARIVHPTAIATAWASVYAVGAAYVGVVIWLCCEAYDVGPVYEDEPTAIAWTIWVSSVAAAVLAVAMAVAVVVLPIRTRRSIRLRLEAQVADRRFDVGTTEDAAYAKLLQQLVSEGNAYVYLTKPGERHQLESDEEILASGAEVASAIAQAADAADEAAAEVARPIVAGEAPTGEAEGVEADASRARADAARAQRLAEAAQARAAAVAVAARRAAEAADRAAVAADRTVAGRVDLELSPAGKLLARRLLKVVPRSTME